MVLIEEKLSCKLPNKTSLFVKLPYNTFIFDSIKQQPIYWYDNKLGQYELPITRLFYLVDLLIKYDDVRVIFYKETQSDLLTCDGIKYKFKPYSYQIDGINYGLNHNGWLLLDEPGLGKTMQSLYLAEALKEKEGIEHCLIICGVNNLKFNWASEIDKVSNLTWKMLGLRKRKNGNIYIGSVEDRCNDLKEKIDEFFVITNIETLQNKKFVESFRKSKNKFGMIILDEAHKVKNPSTLATKNLLKLRAPHVVALTGTLIMNSPENAYVALKWTGNLNCTHSAFCTMYNVYGGFNDVQVIAHKNLDLLQEHIDSCSLRRRKDDELDLPDITYQIEYVEMTPKQKALYDEVAKGIAEELDLLSKRKKLTIMDELVLHMRLRQITAYPGILSTTCTESAKLDRLNDYVEEIVAQGDKVLIFCTFKSTVPEIERRLARYNPLVCTGDTSDIEINESKKKFENSGYNVMVCTWQKMGTGHTLTAANYVIFIDTPWTDADFKQAAERAYRIGQKKHTHIITFICNGTYDERVQEIIERKEILSGYLVDKEICELTQLTDYE